MVANYLSLHSAYSGLITPTNSAYMCENQPELSSTSSSVSSETDLKLRRTSDSAMSHLNNYQVDEELVSPVCGGAPEGVRGQCQA